MSQAIDQNPIASTHTFDLQAFVNQHARWFFLGLLLAFTLQTVALALLLDENIIPDEGMHVRRTEYYMAHPIPMAEQPIDTAGLSQMSHRPFLYYTTLATAAAPVYAITDDDTARWITLRLLNSALAIASVVAVWWLMTRMTENKLLALTVVLLYSQTTMVFYLGSGVNYDNSVFLLSFIGLALTAELIREWRLNTFLLLNIVLQAGSLVKLSALPLYVFCMLVLFVIYWPHLWRSIRGLFGGKVHRTTLAVSANEHINRVLLVLFIFSTLVTAFFYGRNLIEYRTPNPGCEQVLTHEDCLGNNVYRRNHQFTLDDTGERDLNAITYFPRWVEKMGWTLYRFLGHRVLGEPISRELGGAVFGGLLLATAWALIPRDRLYRGLAFVALAYLLFLCYYFNYTVYQAYGLFQVATQGRYLLPVMPLLYFFGALLVYRLAGGRTRWYLAGIAPLVLLVVYAGYGTTLRLIESSWLNEWALALVQSLR